jgi:hypothetical protein
VGRAPAARWVGALESPWESDARVALTMMIMIQLDRPGMVNNTGSALQ